jgi:hypothetical protein
VTGRSYLEAWANRLPLFRLGQTIRYQEGLAEQDKLDRVGLARLSTLRAIWRHRAG